MEHVAQKIAVIRGKDLVEIEASDRGKIGSVAPLGVETGGVALVDVNRPCRQIRERRVLLTHASGPRIAVAEIVHVGFDPAQAPLMRVAVFPRPDGGHDLVWTCHHAITDGWSTAALLAEIAADHDAARAGAPLDTTPSPSCRDYLIWRDDQPDDRDWWQAELGGEGDPVTLTGTLGQPSRPEPGIHRQMTRIKL